MPLSDLNRHIELCTRRLELVDQALLATAAGDYDQADKCDTEIEKITQQLKQLNKELDKARVKDSGDKEPHSIMNNNYFIPADLEWYFAGRQLGTYVVQGDCLGGMKVPDKSTLVIDLDMRPAIGCITICEVEGESELYAKMYLGPSCKGPGKNLVRTYYTDSTRDKSFLASQVQGVAIACFSENGTLLWRRPTDEEIKKDHLSINTREGWIRACREAAIKHLAKQGIEPTDENIAQYQKELKERVDEAVDELIAKQAAASKVVA